MVKTYQLSNKGQYGASIKIAPVTTETAINEDTCLEVNGTRDLKIHPQSVIPDALEMEVKKKQTEKKTCLLQFYKSQNIFKCVFNNYIKVIN